MAPDTLRAMSLYIDYFKLGPVSHGDLTYSNSSPIRDVSVIKIVNKIA